MEDSERAIRGEIIVSGPIADVWTAWTTEAGIKAFLGPESRIELKTMGAYEIYFNPAAAPGEKGSEGCVVLAVDAPRMLSFTWNAPPKFPNIRKQRTHVTVRLKSLGAASTRVTLVQDGWGEGPEWDLVFDYFIKAWLEGVLPALKQHFAKA
jgi:uncharacterized protein YndB with AHSA1/START domain